jgi:hypothetical protein
MRMSEDYDETDVLFNEIGMLALRIDTPSYLRLKAAAEAVTRQLESALRELERWRHGNTIEGDFVCPNELALVEARAAYLKESELASAMLAEVDRLRALLSETQDEERKRCKTIGELGGTATELRTRRAQDLTDEEREALRYGHDVIRGSMVARYSRHDEACEKSLAILDRLLSRGGGE